MVSRRSGAADGSGSRPPPDAVPEAWSDVAGLGLGAGFGPTMAWLAGINALGTVSDAFLVPDRPLAALCSAGTALLLVLLVLSHRRRAWSGAAVRHLVGGAALLMALDVTLHVVVLVDPLYTMFVLVSLVAFGAVLTDRRWLVATQAVGVAGLAAVALPRRSELGWSTSLVGAAFALVLHRHAARGLERVQALTTALAAAAARDPLTGLLNRQGLHESVHRLPAGAAVPGTAEGGASTTVLCFDVDGRASTTRSATPPGTRCWSRSPTRCGRWPVRATWPRAWAVTSSSWWRRAWPPSRPQPWPRWPGRGCAGAPATRAPPGASASGRPAPPAAAPAPWTRCSAPPTRRCTRTSGPAGRAPGSTSPPSVPMSTLC